MTLTDVVQPTPSPAPAWWRGRRLVVGASIALALVAGGLTAATYYYDSVPLVESAVTYPVAEPSPVVAHAVIAAVDPDFSSSGDSLITRRYLEITSGGASGLRMRIMVNKAEAGYTKTEILSRYLNRADFGRGAVGLVAAARTYFHKPAEQLTVAEAAVLAVQLDPDRPAPQAGWEQVLTTMVDRGWLTSAERAELTYPA